MEHDHRPLPTELTGIHINLAEQAIEFEDRHGTVGRLRFTGQTVLYEGAPLLLTTTQATDATNDAVPPVLRERGTSRMPVID